MPEDCGNLLEISLNYSLKNTFTLPCSEFIFSRRCSGASSAKTARTELAHRHSVCVYIKNIPGRKIKMFFSKSGVFPGNKEKQTTV